MKKLSLIFTAFILLSFTTKDERINIHRSTLPEDVDRTNKTKEFLLDYFQQTVDGLHKSIEGLSDSQMQYKSSPDRWSISQCLEHIVITEGMLFGMSKELLAKPANPERKMEIKVSDQEVLDGISSRSHKATAPPEVQPQGKFNSTEAALQELKKQRAEILKFINKTSEEDLRNHISDSPFGPFDGFHSLLYIAGHTERHTHQIEEIKTDAGFPAE